MRKIWCLAAMTAVAGMAVAAPAMALPAPSEAEGLLPLQARAVGVMADDSDLNAVAGSINQAMNPEDETTNTVMDLIDSSFLSGILDENGEVKLPLGITVFNTMGDMSVGFGSSF